MTKENPNEWRDWSSLPIEILDYIVSKMHGNTFHDVNSFRAVCTQWHRSYFPKDLGFDSQWLIQCNRLGSALKLFHPLIDKSFIMNDISELRGFFIRCSKDGWLLMSKGREMFFFRPFPISTINLPSLPGNPKDITGFTFTCDPTSNDCLVFGVGEHTEFSTVLFSLSRNENNWNRTIQRHGRNFYLCQTNPVYYNGKLYYLGEFGNLAFFDFTNFTGQTLTCHRSTTGKHSYLLECNGKLLAVFLCPMSAVVKVCEWDDISLIWKEITKLGEYMLFLSGTTSFSKLSLRASMKNKIYLPMLSENLIVFYCLEQGFFRTFKCNTPIKHLTMCLGYCWMEPTKFHNDNKVICSERDDLEYEGDDDSDANSMISSEIDYDRDFYTTSEYIAYYGFDSNDEDDLSSDDDM